MGDSTQDPESDETSHEVTLTKPYYMALSETTNREYREFEPTHDSGNFRGDGLNADQQPVVEVSHDDAVKYAAWLSAQDRTHVYRLPTEVEWEYACRAGTRTRRWWGDEDVGAKGNASVTDPISVDRYRGVDSSRFPAPSSAAFSFDDGFRVTAPVATFAPNPWGLYDMLGNVSEVCADWLDYEYYGTSSAKVDPTGPTSGEGSGRRVVRGGSWYSASSSVTCAHRSGATSDSRYFTTGFRLVATVPTK
jgi:formylglycine-generating enzyme required for sulfatase activity